MVLSIPDMSAKYPAACTDADGDPMDGATSYRLPARQRSRQAVLVGDRLRL
jgi:hypothetical protein